MQSKFTLEESTSSLKMLKASSICIIIFATLLSCADIQAQISSVDSTNLVSYLEDLTIDWDQNIVDSANVVLGKTVYDHNDWTLFFAAYFDTHIFNTNLRFYLNYPVLYWLSITARTNLQMAINAVFTNKIETIMEDHSDNLGNAMVTDTVLRTNLVNYHCFMNYLLGQSLLDSINLEIYSFYKSQIESYPNIFYKPNTINTSSSPYVGWLRLQNYLNFREVLEINDTLKNQMATTLGLENDYLNIFIDYEILLIDNNGFNEVSLNFIYKYISSIPSSLHELKSISAYSFLGNEGSYYLQPCFHSLINIFSIQIGESNSNPFPNDISPYTTSGLAQVLAHEFNHIVDAHVIVPDPTLEERKDSLLERACPNHMDFLRSMFDGTFFCQYPHEFFASISNQWFANSEHTLRLGINRFADGWLEPINQFLFFAEVYSNGNDTTYFYDIDIDGDIGIYPVLVQRDINGYINSLNIPHKDTIYYFNLNLLGSVTSIPGISYSCGDVNLDDRIDITDAVFLVNYIFIGAPSPSPIEAGDTNCDGLLNISDAFYIVSYIFTGGGYPCDTDGDGQPDC